MLDLNKGACGFFYMIYDLGVGGSVLFGLGFFEYPGLFHYIILAGN